jgi:hypothetical protein
MLAMNQFSRSGVSTKTLQRLHIAYRIGVPFVLLVTWAGESYMQQYWLPVAIRMLSLGSLGLMMTVFQNVYGCAIVQSLAATSNMTRRNPPSNHSSRVRALLIVMSIPEMVAWVIMIQRGIWHIQEKFTLDDPPPRRSPFEEAVWDYAHMLGIVILTYFFSQTTKSRNATRNKAPSVGRSASFQDKSRPTTPASQRSLVKSTSTASLSTPTHQAINLATVAGNDDRMPSSEFNVDDDDDDDDGSGDTTIVCHTADSRTASYQL